MSSHTPSHLTTVVATYRVQAGKEEAFFALLAKHHPTLLAAGLATPDPPIVYRGAEEEGQPIVFEIFTWVDPEAPGRAHQLPAVMAIWEPMGALVEDRKTGPKFCFPHVELVTPQGVRAS